MIIPQGRRDLAGSAERGSGQKQNWITNGKELRRISHDRARRIPPHQFMKRNALKAAFPYTIPIMAGFLFLGMTYGVLMNTSGFSFIYPMLMSFTIFAGSVEFMTVSMLLSPFHPLQAFTAAFMVNARHLFYGISMLNRYNSSLGLKRLYLIYGMCDESFSINYTAEVPEGVDRGWFYFWVTALNQIYWVTGATLGGIFGSLIQFNTQGLDFVMTSMFVVIFLDQWLKESDHRSSLLGMALSVLCLLGFGPDNFMIPAMLSMLIVLTAARRRMEDPKAAAALSDSVTSKTAETGDALEIPDASETRNASGTLQSSGTIERGEENV